MGWADLTFDERMRVGGAMHPGARRRFREHGDSGDRFAHYTTAEAATRMIADRQVWMRRANAMNDFSELEHGVARLEAARSGRAWTAFCAALDSTHPGAAEAVTAALPAMVQDARCETYLTALCRHPVQENDLGRLSMWRAYGGDTGVCLVLNPGVLLRPSQALKVFNHPVEYHADGEFQQMLLTLAGSLLSELALLRRMHVEEVVEFTLLTLLNAVLCTKHPGFAEEREWRLIHSPLVEASERVPCEVRSVRGAPQRVHLLPLRDIPAEGLYGLEPATLVERIIVGPSANPEPVREAMVHTLRAAGATDAERRVVVSAIPLRR